MSGIINYIHGEEGVVESLTIERDEEGRLFRLLQMSGNPFRLDAIDYGADIRIEPTLAVGDRVCYVRLDPTCGFWVRSADRYRRQIDQALGRWVAPGEDEAGVPSREFLRRADATELVDASIFLSHSSWNKLFARFLRRDLQRFARVTVWLDEEQGDSREIQPKLESWLRKAVDQAKGIVVLWTEACRTSEWVRHEYEWAIERSATVPVVVVKCDGTPVPDSLVTCAHVVPVEGLWYAHGLGEEIFSYLHGFEPRSRWLIENTQQGSPIEPDRAWECMTFDDIAPHEGTADGDLQWSINDGRLCWSFPLRARQTGYTREVSGPNESKGHLRNVKTSVDFGITKGCRVARIASYRTSLAWSGRYFTHVWMRIDEPALEPEWVSACHHCQLSIARELEHYRPQAIDPSDVELPAWFNPEAIAAECEYSEPDAILDAAEMLIFNRIQLKRVHRERNAQLNPEEYEWLQIDELGRQLHDAGVASMLEHGFKWCPNGYRREGYSPDLAPFESMEGSYRQSLLDCLALAVLAIIKSGIGLVRPSGRVSDRVGGLDLRPAVSGEAARQQEALGEADTRASL